MKPWARRILDLLEAQKRSMRSLAKVCGISAPSVSQWFGRAGDKPPTEMIAGDHLVAVAEWLGTTPDWIIHGRGQSPASRQSQGVQLSEETISQAFELLGLMAKFRPDYPELERATWPRVKIATKAVARMEAGEDQRIVISDLLAELIAQGDNNAGPRRT